MIHISERLFSGKTVSQMFTIRIWPEAKFKFCLNWPCPCDRTPRASCITSISCFLYHSDRFFSQLKRLALGWGKAQESICGLDLSHRVGRILSKGQREWRKKNTAKLGRMTARQNKLHGFSFAGPGLIEYQLTHLASCSVVAQQVSREVEYGDLSCRTCTLVIWPLQREGRSALWGLSGHCPLHNTVMAASWNESGVSVRRPGMPCVLLSLLCSCQKIVFFLC